MSCVPVGYVFILIDAMRNDPSDSQSNANKVKMMKILRHVPKTTLPRFSGLQCAVDDFFPLRRLVRLAKNIARIARLKKLKTLLEEYEDYFEPIMTGLHLFKLFVGLIFLGHLMACCWCANLCLTVDLHRLSWL